MAFFKVYYDEEQECVIASLEGKVGFEIIKKYAESILKTGDKHHCKTLFNDLQKAELRIQTFTEDSNSNGCCHICLSDNPLVTSMSSDRGRRIHINTNIRSIHPAQRRI